MPDITNLPENGTILMNKEDSHMSGLSVFTKDRIMNCYTAMLDYIYDDEVESEERYGRLMEEIEKQRPAIPEEVYSQIYDFAVKEIGDIVYGDGKYEFEGIAPEEFVIHDDGRVKFKTERATMKAMANFVQMLDSVERKIHVFGMEVLHPYLMA